MKHFTLKLFLFIACLCGATSVWAETVGASDFSTGYLGAHSTVQNIASGGSMHYVFTQSKATDANYKGWILWAGAAGSEVNWANGISIVRGDNWDDKWPNGTEFGSNAGCTSNFNWDIFNSEMNGATVDMTVSYENGALTMNSTITSSTNATYTFSYAKTVDGAPASVDVCLSVNAASLNITTAEYTAPAAVEPTTASVISGIPYSVDFSAAGATIAPFDQNVEIKSNGNGTAVALACSSRGTTANAFFDVDADTEGNQSYAIAANEKVSAKFTVFLTWVGYANTQTVALLNDGDVTLASFTYNDQATNITDVKIGGATPEGFSAIAGLKPAGDGFDKWTSAPSPVEVTISISGSGGVTLNFVSASKGVNTSVVGTLPEGTALNLARIAFSNYAYNDKQFNNNRAMPIKSISLTSETVSEAEVTYKYVDTEGNDLSSLNPDKSSMQTIGTAIADVVPDSYKTDFYSSDESVKYVFDSFECADETVPATGTTVTLKFAAKAKFTYNVKAVDSNENELATIATVSGYDGDNLSTYWSKYIKVGNQWYVADAPFYQDAISADGTKNVVFSVSDIAYFIECENMNGVRQDRWVRESNANNSGYYKIRINNYYPTIYTEPIEEEGVYSLEIPYNNSNSANHTYQISIRDNEGNLTQVVEWTSQNGAKVYTYDGIVIPAGSSLAISCNGISGNSNARMDYLTLKKSTISKSISEAGYATLYSDKALDFTNVEGLKAYIITAANGDKLTTQKVTKIPANTGVLLEGEAGTYDIPVAASAEPVEGNRFEGVLEATEKEAGIFVLMNSTAGVGFYKTSNTFTVGAGTAYLPADIVPAEVKALRINQEGTTAIQGIDSEVNEANAEIYNLAGQRVVALTKGIYVINGKKVMVK